jgi:hypothetical protein
VHGDSTFAVLDIFIEHRENEKQNSCFREKRLRHLGEAPEGTLGRLGKKSHLRVNLRVVVFGHHTAPCPL